jgi:hypothetical protein
MVRDSVEYISEFLAFYGKLKTDIFLIDHRSLRDYRKIELPNLTVLRSNHHAQFQSELTNLVIREFSILESYDWLFVLDVDEFLPFYNVTSFHKFLKEHKRKKVLKFFWSNGAVLDGNSDFISLIDARKIAFFKTPSSHSKSFANIARVGSNILIPTGSHQIKYLHPSHSRKTFNFRKREVYRAHQVKKYLHHIVATDRDQFLKKLSRYIEQINYRKHVVGQGGWTVQEYPKQMHGDEWLRYVANFRLSNKELNQKVSKEDFVLNNIFSEMDSGSVKKLRGEIFKLDTEVLPEQTSLERRYLKNKVDDTEIDSNLLNFNIDSNKEILLI